MIGMYAITAAGLIAAGIPLGMVLIVSIGVRREKKTGRWLTVNSPGPLAGGVRTVTALYVRRPRAAHRRSTRSG